MIVRVMGEGQFRLEGDAVGRLGRGTAPHQGREEAEVQDSRHQTDTREANHLLRELDPRSSHGRHLSLDQDAADRGWVRS